MPSLLFVVNCKKCTKIPELYYRNTRNFKNLFTFLLLYTIISLTGKGQVQVMPIGGNCPR